MEWTAEDDPVDADLAIEHQCAEEDEDDGDDKCEVEPILYSSCMTVRLQASASSGGSRNFKRGGGGGINNGSLWAWLMGNV